MRDYVFENKTVLVTGGAGFIGSHLVDACLRLKAKKVISFDNLAGLELGRNNHAHLRGEERFEFVQGDTSNWREIAPEVARADVIFSQAAAKLVHGLKDPIRDAKTNILGNLNILEAIKKYSPHARLIHASTGSVFGSGHDTFHEDSRKNPITVYGISKNTAENYIEFYHKEHGIKATILRYFSVYGPRQDYQSDAGVVSVFISQAMKGESPKIFGSGNQTRRFTPVAQVVEANLLAYKNDNTIGETYNVAYDGEISINDLAHKIIERYGKGDIKPEYLPSREGDAEKINPSTSKIKEIGFEEKTSFEEGLDITAEWVREELKI